MKILVISLLRLGDLIQQISLFKGLREQYPDAQIDLLLNKQFSQVQNIMGPYVDNFIYFDRDLLQRGLGEASYNILWSYSELEKLISQLNQEKYDVAFNFTHNRLSAHLLGALEVKEKQGLHHSNNQFLGLENRWLRYFNDRFSGSGKSIFHYIEILSQAFSIPVKKFEVATNRKKTKMILFQCLTSDQKKNWGLDQFVALKQNIEQSLNDYQVKILGAPFEREILSSYFSDKDLLIGTLSEAREALLNADLVVTGDTSIKHMAAELGTAIVEISVGSSDSVKTGAFTSGVTILRSEVPCAPCSHSEACSQKSHLCAESIDVERVFEAVWKRLAKEPNKEKSSIQLLDRAVWSSYLGHHQDLNGEIASISQVDLGTWLSLGEQYRRWLQGITRGLPSRQTFMGLKNFKSSDISDLIFCAQDILKSKLDTAGYFQAYIEALTAAYVHPVQIYDRIATALEEIEELLHVREALTETFQSVSKEGTYYAKGIGKLPISGFDEAREGLSRDQKDPRIQSRSREDATP